jgi:TRAP-type C4-dicarboxylate transport system substrate-binding protein
MPDETIQAAVQQMARLFEGLSPQEQKALLAALERAGAAVYRSLAADEKDEIFAVELLSAAEREEANALVLENHL